MVGPQASKLPSLRVLGPNEEDDNNNNFKKLNYMQNNRSNLSLNLLGYEQAQQQCNLTSGQVRFREAGGGQEDADREEGVSEEESEVRKQMRREWRERRISLHGKELKRHMYHSSSSSSSASAWIHHDGNNNSDPNNQHIFYGQHHFNSAKGYGYCSPQNNCLCLIFTSLAYSCSRFCHSIFGRSSGGNDIQRVGVATGSSSYGGSSNQIAYQGNTRLMIRVKNFLEQPDSFGAWLYHMGL